MLEDGAHKSTESLNIYPAKRPAENPEMSDGDNDIVLGELDLELDAQLELAHPGVDQRIPDCIVELVMNEDHRGDELTVAFSESIGQRVRRERPSRVSVFDSLEPSDLVKDTNQSDSEAREKEQTKEEEAEGAERRDGGEKGTLKVLDFVGDWPSQGSREQRRVERSLMPFHKEGDGKGDEAVSREAHGNKTNVKSGPTVEIQRLLDLIQTGAMEFRTGSSPLSSLSLSPGGEFEKEEEAGSRFEESCGSASNSDEKEQNMSRVNSSRGELPDCVLNWKVADQWEGLKPENKASCNRGESDDSNGVDSPPIADSLAISQSAEANVSHNEVERCDTEEEVGAEPSTGPTDADAHKCSEDSRETALEADVSRACQSPACEGSAEAGSSGGSQERKQRQGRRSGKQRKLALTFTQNCAASSVDPPGCPNATAQNKNGGVTTDAETTFSLNRSLGLEPTPNVFAESEAQPPPPPPPPPPLPAVAEGCPSQTEPRDFALLWRLNHQEGPGEAVVIPACSQPADIVVLSADSSRFAPEMSAAMSAAVAVGPSCRSEVPYHVAHEKGTQVEERELETRDRLESLRILSRHFKLVSFDTLEDLYDKCHQDLEWTTNLLLDSGERFFREEDSERNAKDAAVDEGDQNAASLCGVSGRPSETSSCRDLLDQHHSEHLPPGFEEGPRESTFGTSKGLNESSRDADVPVNKDHPDDTATHLGEAPQTELGPPHAVNTGERCSVAEHKAAPEGDLEGGALGGSFESGDGSEGSTVAIEEMASIEEIHRLLQAELDKIEREEKQKEQERTERRHKGEGRSRHLDIQSVELKLPTEVALQLTELFGPVGVDPGK